MSGVALGIVADSPQRSEDLQRKARPAGERPDTNKHNGKIASCLAMTELRLAILKS